VTSLLARAGFAPTHAWCESALHAAQDGRWRVVLGASRNYLLESGGVAVPFDRPAGTDLPLAIRIAVDEARARGAAPAEIQVVVESGAATAEPAAWTEQTGVPVAAVTAPAHARAAPIADDSIDLLSGDFAPASRRFSGLGIPRLAVVLACTIVFLQVGLSAYDWWRMEGTRRALEGERVAIFQSAFPEARTIVDPALQMSRNLADLQRSRGQLAGDDFLALATAAARGTAPGPARKLTYANGKFEVERGEAKK
jgi:general secretion pathway protein L